MNKKEQRAAAVIDIGSSAVRMNIAQWDGERMQPLDYLEKAVSIGQEVFTTGRISFETVRSLSTILSGFCAVAREYDIPKAVTVATTALREARNQAYVLDHLAVQNRLDVRVLEDPETSALIFHMLLARTFPESERVPMVYAGTGTLDFSMRSGGRIRFTQSLRTGLIKIAELLRETSEYSIAQDRIAEEYLRIFLSRPSRMQEFVDTDDLVFSVAEAQPLLRICGADPESASVVLKKSAVMEAYEAFRRLSFEQISAKLGLEPQRAGTVYAAFALLTSLLQLTKAKRVHCLQMNLSEALLDLHLRPGARKLYNDELNSAAIDTAIDLRDRFRCDRDHADRIRVMAMILFDSLRKLHGLSKRQGLYLQLACILHEVGHYTNATDTSEATFTLVHDAQLHGLRMGETLLVANIISPQNLPGKSRGDTRKELLRETDGLSVAKMHALLRLADALDYSRLGKAKLVEAEHVENRLLLHLRSREDFSLEQWAFYEQAPLFQEVFGIEPQIIIENEKRI